MKLYGRDHGLVIRPSVRVGQLRVLQARVRLKHLTALLIESPGVRAQQRRDWVLLLPQLGGCLWLSPGEELARLLVFVVVFLDPASVLLAADCGLGLGALELAQAGLVLDAD